MQILMTLVRVAMNSVRQQGMLEDALPVVSLELQSHKLYISCVNLQYKE
jgi:hypothetical protein